MPRWPGFASPIITPRPFSSVTGPGCRSCPTSRLRIGRPLSPSSSSPPATPASPSPSLDDGEESTTPATSGPSFSTPFAIFDLESLSWRTWADTLGSDFPSSSVTLPKRGSMRSGRLYEQPTSGPVIDGNASSLLPTPSANQYECDQEVWETRRARLKAEHKNGNGFGLTTAMAVQKLLPSPMVGARNSTAKRNRTPPSGVHDGDTLTDAISRMLPTPTARLGDSRGPQAKRYLNPERSNDLDDAMAWLGDLTNEPSDDGSLFSVAAPRPQPTSEDD